MIKELIGAFGGKKQKSPVRTQDTLISEDYVEVMLGLCQGPIKGLVPGQLADRPLQNFFIGDTPLQNAATGLSNFTDFNADFYNGYDEDGVVTAKLGGNSSNMTIGVRLSQDDDVIRQTPATMRGYINQLEFRIMFNQLYRQDDNGVFETDAKFAIAYKLSTSPTWLYYKGESVSTIRGKTTNGYVKDFLIDVPLQSTADYDVRVTKLSPDNGTVDFVEITWESLQMTTLSSRQYQNVAVAHLYGKASNQFNSIPDFSGIYDGLILKVPTNYNPETRTYDETTPWDGTFKEAYTNNGPWALYNMIINPECGMAKYYKNVAANRYEFYEAAKWCDEMVSDGKGGLQPRFTYNDLITDLRPGLEALRYVAGSFNSVIFDDGNGMIRLKTDKPQTPDQIFTPENISKAGFNYTFSDITTRINDVSVEFINPDLDWEPDRRWATLDTSRYKAANGLITEEFTAVGCIDVHEAMRRANYRIITSNTEITSVSFVTSRFGVITEVFNTIYVADPDAGWSTGGRIKSVFDGVIYLRDPIYFSSLPSVKLKVQTYTGLVEVTVSPATTGAVYSLSITSGTLPEDLPDRTVFTAENVSTMGIAKPFKVLKIEPVDGSPDEYQIVAIEVNVNKYPDGDANTISDLVTYSAKKPGIPGQVFNLTAESGTKHLLKLTDGTLIPRIYVSWVRPVRTLIDHYEVDYQKTGSEVWITETLFNESLYIRDVKEGDAYDIHVTSVSPLGVRSQPVVLEDYIVLGKEEPPPQVTGLILSGGSIAWDEIDLNEVPDLRGYILRFHYGENTDWNSAAKLHDGFLTESPFTPTYRLTGPLTVLAKALDTSGNESTSPAIAYGELGNIGISNIAQSFELDPTFLGELENCSVVSGALVASPVDLFYGPDNAPFYGADSDLFYKLSGGYNQMVYTTPEIVITGAVDESLTALDLIADGVSVVVEYREYKNGVFYGLDADPFYGPDSSPFYNLLPDKWKIWKGPVQLLNGSYQWRVTITSGIVQGNISLMNVLVSSPTRYEELSNVTIAAGGTIVPYTLANVTVIKTVQVTLQKNSAGGVRWEVDKTNPLAPVIIVYNSSGISVGGATVDITIGAY